MKNYFLLLATALVTMSAGAQKVEMSVERMQPAQKVAVANQQIQIKQLSKGIYRLLTGSSVTLIAGTTSQWTRTSQSPSTAITQMSLTP